MAEPALATDTAFKGSNVKYDREQKVMEWTIPVENGNPVVLRISTKESGGGAFGLGKAVIGRVKDGAAGMAQGVAGQVAGGGAVGAVIGGAVGSAVYTSIPNDLSKDKNKMPIDAKTAVELTEKLARTPNARIYFTKDREALVIASGSNVLGSVPGKPTDFGRDSVVEQKSDQDPKTKAGRAANFARAAELIPNSLVATNNPSASQTVDPNAEAKGVFVFDAKEKKLVSWSPKVGEIHKLIDENFASAPKAERDAAHNAVNSYVAALLDLGEAKHVERKIDGGKAVFTVKDREPLVFDPSVLTGSDLSKVKAEFEKVSKGLLELKKTQGTDIA